ncbi:hypothetical protein ACPRNU_05790 [Chromobacterium vaccinii]|uniref:hypothetical protein n=1 Tax=Chromobacterium vaccinii TaxID=1108595 RepID=UPI003C78486D
MPNPVTPQQTVDALNAALAQMSPPGDPVDTLDTGEMSDPAWSCNTFAPLLLEKVCAEIGVDPYSLDTESYVAGAALPQAFPNQSFVNISMMGEPSALNHNFNILVDGYTVWLIEAFVDQTVPIVKRFDSAVFFQLWNSLSGGGNGDWSDAYMTLFSVGPDQVVYPPPQNTWLHNQYVTS